MEKHITIKDVARKAKVGIATVSRVLNNSHRVDPETRKSIQAVIRQLGYRPNASGRRLVKKATEMVCFLLSNREFMNPFHSGVLHGVERYLSGAGHDVVFTNLHYAPDTAAGDLALPRIVNHRGIADGFILSGTNYPNLVAAMDGLRAPYVLFGNNLVGGRGRRSDAVYYDDASSSRHLVEKLIAMGHRHIWYLGDLTLPWFRRRAECYRQAMKANGLAPNEYTESYDRDDRDYGASYGTRAVNFILVQQRPVTALVAGNDGIAYGAWRALQRVGLRVPGDLSLVGFDDVNEAQLTDPELTTVHVPTEELGQACASMLLEKLRHHGAPQKPVVIGTRLVERGSWGPPKV